MFINNTLSGNGRTYLIHLYTVFKLPETFLQLYSLYSVTGSILSSRSLATLDILIKRRSDGTVQFPSWGPSGPNISRDWIARAGHSVVRCQTVSVCSWQSLQSACSRVISFLL